MTLDLSHLFKDEDIVKQICYIGQPVSISKNESVLRIALGGDSFRQVVKDMKNDSDTGPGSAVADDKIIIKKLAFLAENFEELKAHEAEVKKQEADAIQAKLSAKVQAQN